MKRFLTSLLALVLVALCGHAERYRVIISTDIGGTDPDDNQSMTHLLMYANEFDIEGLISSPSYGSGSAAEILRMIDLYEQDLPRLAAGLASTGSDSRYPAPDSLRAVVRQGSRGEAPLCGYSAPTEGSQWIVECARRDDQRPLWVLVWGAMEDVVQALHDAPDIAPRLRVYWIGGPNKKWGCNAYNYLINYFPNLWFIENNATYRGLIGSAKDTSTYQAPFWETFMKGAGSLGDDFKNYYDGIVKMGDTPSLLYLMNGNPLKPGSPHWGGRFEPITVTPKYVVDGPLTERDTVALYSLMEWRLQGPDLNLPSDSVCFTLNVDRQRWRGYHEGNGIYVVRYAPKAPATLPYTIVSGIDGLESHEGTFVVGEHWPAIDEYSCSGDNIKPVPVRLGQQWFTDLQDYPGETDDATAYPTMRQGQKGRPTRWQGTSTIAIHRDEIMADWARRLSWLKR